MLYRRHVEFAVGHGISIHAEVAKDAPDRAVLVKTTIVPSYEVPRTTPPTSSEPGSPAFAKLADLVLLTADPTADINNAKAIDTVIKGGQVIDRKKLDLPVNR